MFGDLSFSHILILLLVLVLVFGARRIPEIGSSLGQGIREFKRSLKDVIEDRPEPPRSVPPAASSTPSSSLPTGGDPKRLNQ
jgi:sec-independent protein translocase protein TatA